MSKLPFAIMKIKTIISSFLPAVLIYLFDLVVLNPLNAYLYYPRIDIPMHFFGGMSIAYAYLGLMGDLEQKKHFTADPWLKNLFIVSLVAFTAVAWEWYEFILSIGLDIITQPSEADTMKDLLVGTLGGLVWCLLNKLNTSRSSPKKTRSLRS